MSNDDPSTRPKSETVWFEVGSIAEVVDGSGAVIGRLQPGREFRALAITGLQVSVPGPGGSVGYVARSAIRLLPERQHATAAPPAATSPPIRTQSPPTPSPGSVAGTIPSLGTSWVLPGVALLVFAAAMTWVMLGAGSSQPEPNRTDTAAISGLDVGSTEDATANEQIAGSTEARATADTATSSTQAQAQPTQSVPATGQPTPALGTAVSFGPPDLGPSISVDVCPSGSLSLGLYDVIVRDGTSVRASGYGVVDSAGQGRLSVWYENEAGHLIGFDQPGDPYAVTVTADILTIRGPRFDLDLVYLWTLPPSQAERHCETIDGLVETLGV